MSGVVAAGHPVTAEAGADVLRAGGNAVDAAIAAMLASFVAEPHADGARRGRLHARRAARRRPRAARLLRRGARAARATRRRARRSSPSTSPSATSCRCSTSAPRRPARTGRPRASARPRERFGTVPLADLAAPAAALARDGVEVTAEQAYVLEILAPIEAATPESRALFMPEGRLLQAGRPLPQPRPGRRARAAGGRGRAPFYTGDVAERVCAWVADRGGTLGPADLAATARATARRSGSTTTTATCCSTRRRAPAGS